MIGMLPYLRSQYGDTVKSYLSQQAVQMQARQRWDKNKGGLVGKDDKFIADTPKADSC